MPANIFSIAPGLPFLRTLAEGILDGTIVPGRSYRGDVLGLAGVTIYLPTRRAAMALRAEFARALGGISAVLPAIRTLGEADDAGLFEGGAPIGLEPVIEPLDRRLLIARFVRQWKTATQAAAVEAMTGETIQPPSSAADALWLAKDLCTLLDEAETEGVAFAALSDLAPERLAAWWQLTLTFLDILARHWPAVLAERGVTDPFAARNAALLREAARLGSSATKGPLIVAGSTATAPATVALMRAVAGLPNGAVVLPGLDRHLSDEDFDAIHLGTGPGRTGAAPGHPQYGLKRILSQMLLPRGAVDHLAPEEGTKEAAREAFLSDAFRPAGTTDAWGESAARHPAQSLDGLALVEAVDEREEALAIAVAMRGALSDPASTVALTTPDRSLARRVVAELARFGISANDSAGRPLSATAPGTLMELALEAALRPGDPVVLLGLLKHPLLRLGHAPVEARNGARAVELVALRGQVGTADAAHLSALFETASKLRDEPGARVARAVRLLSEEDLDRADVLLKRLEAALLPLTALREAPAGEIGPFARALAEVLEQLAADPEGDASALYAAEAGQALAGFLQKLVAAGETGFSFEPAELPDVVAALVAGETVRPRGGSSARAFVWGTLEARLQRVDVMVLGGLNEGTWPQRATNDAFLSRTMRAEVSLDPPERLIGLAAHDVAMALGSPRVVMTRSMRAGGAPAIASRWLQRLLTLAGPAGAARLREEGAVYLDHARALDAGEEARPATRPEPRPPLAARPNRYSITEIETLVRDPYAVHARRILKLEPLPDLIRAPGASDRGNLFHDILAEFVRREIDAARPDAEAKLLAIAAEKFEAERLPPEVEAVWWPRMETLAGHYVAWERARNPEIAARFAEARGEVEFAELGTILSGYADRIDRRLDGSVEIIDFKTGITPSVRQARTLLAPQLPLEGAMTRLGGFQSVGKPASVADLVYLRLRESSLDEEGLAYTDRKTGAEVTADDLSDWALDKVRGLFAEYRKAEMPFASRARPFMAGAYDGPYDHLARAREWSVGEEPGSSEEGAA
ncbi:MULTISPECIES: double-strand break repair protein AddB [unclassified Aureimonas]|uniref:double-strand break repair protein AddB n=1 Tax=unclassified Aureimonas TaxID=2615206 RepID=UPI00070200D8|nr:MULTISPECIES: double-strand break repair protein AddB [unclassified Aureimonas]KQT64358.1 double-strand break repair protein AddB [Aureimonas sp. Leaf427]KQT81547.1 double-strand break repair protein AddB [Aureimonas sp. Leaf460]